MSLKTFSLRRKQPSTSHPIQGVEMPGDQTASMKRGDEKRIMLMKMVKEGIVFFKLLFDQSFLFLISRQRGTKIKQYKL